MIISRAPVRISMGGGGTDLPSYYEKHGGFLLAAAINKYIYIMVEKRFQESIRLSYSETEIVDRVSQIKHRIFREALKHVNIEKKIELISLADIPANCGLGTSSAFTVALLNGLFEHKKIRLSREHLAEAACHIEIDVLQEPIGKQDQYVAAFGGFNAYWFHKDGGVEVKPVKIKEENLLELQNNIILFYLNRERAASDVLIDQHKKSMANDQFILERLHKIKELGFYTKKIFEEKEELDEFGEILHEHWLIKKGLSNKISDPFIDEAYETARKNGAIGGKVVGAGGGGFLLIYCPRQKSRLVNAMKKMELDPVWFTFAPEGARVGYYQ